MNTLEAKEFIEPFFTYSEGQIYDKFIGFSDENKRTGQYYKKGDHSSLYIKGTRKDRVLLVSHVDTVWFDSDKINPIYQDGVFVSGNRKRGLNKNNRQYTDGLGIGADDRAGVGILWYLRNSGHSLLLVSGEEIGLLGSRQLISMEGAEDELQDHQFAVQFDRQGRKDLIFYNVGTQEFADYCVSKTNYRINQGSVSDICALCTKMTGVNLSVGYYNEHTPSEMLSVPHWNNTLQVAEKWLSETDIPAFRQ